MQIHKSEYSLQTLALELEYLIFLGHFMSCISQRFCFLSVTGDSLVFQEKEESQVHVSTLCCRGQQIQKLDTTGMH